MKRPVVGVSRPARAVVAAALSRELTALLPKIQILRVLWSNPRVVEARYGRHTILAATLGSGAARSSSAMAALLTLLDPYAVDGFVLVGVSGALDEATPLGTVLRGYSVAADAEVLPLASGFAGLEWCDLPEASLVTTREIVTGEARRAARTSAEGPHLADLETAHVARACAQRNVPCVSLRVACDGPHSELPAWLPGCVDGDGAVSSIEVVRRAAVAPASWATLATLRSRVAEASESLARAVLGALDAVETRERLC